VSCGRRREQPNARDRCDSFAFLLPALPRGNLALDLGHLLGQAALHERRHLAEGDSHFRYLCIRIS